MVGQYFIHLLKEQIYAGHHNLCDECANSFKLDDDNKSLHFSNPTNMECEICGGGNSDD